MNKIKEAAIEADPKLPVIRMARDFAATPGQLFRAHTDPALFARWVGPEAMTTRIEHWDARTGGSWQYVTERDGVQYRFRGCFHEARPDRIVQTFTFEGEPDGVALGTLWFEDLGDGRTRLRSQLLVRQLRGPRRLAAQRHGDRCRRGLRQAGQDARRWRCLTARPSSPRLGGNQPAGGVHRSPLGSSLASSPHRRSGHRVAEDPAGHGQGVCRGRSAQNKQTAQSARRGLESAWYLRSGPCSFPQGSAGGAYSSHVRRSVIDCYNG